MLSVLLLLATLAGRVGAWWWVFDLASHFAVQLAVGGALVAALAVWARAHHWAAVAGLSLLVNAFLVVPLYVPPASAAGGGRELRLLSFNVNSLNDNVPGVLEHIRGSQSHLVLVMEVTPAWLTALKTLEPEYHLDVAEPRTDNFGIALLSRQTEVTTKLVRTQDGIAFVDARLDGLSVLGVHPVPPVGEQGTADRNAALDLIAAWVGEQTGPVVVLGDLNTTPFSPSFARLTNAGLTSSQRGFGVQATWPQFPWFLAPGRIPIDHALHSPAVRTRARNVDDGRGSDHRPLMVTVALP